MRTDCKIDNRKVICKNSTLIGHSTNVCKAGDFFTYCTDGAQTHLARSLGRVSAPSLSPNDSPIKGYILAMVLSNDATFAFERWVNPDDVLSVNPVPTHMAAFFFAPTIPYDAEMIRRLGEHGTLSDEFIENAAHHVAAWNAGVSPAAFNAGIKKES
jgi:hypothetical protein